jgi:acetyl esterase/lipase
MIVLVEATGTTVTLSLAVTVILLVASAALVFASVWIAIPAPNLVLLALGVGAPELSPGLFAAAIVLLIAAMATSAGAIGRVTIGVSAVAAVLSVLPIVRFIAVRGSLDAALGETRSGVSVGDRFTRSSRFSTRDFIFGIPTGPVRVTRAIEFARPANAPLSLDVYRPIDDGNHPVVIQLYGGAWQRGASGDNETFARWLASCGYTVFAIDYRHAPKWQWPAQREDVQAALSWIAGHAGEYGGDASRIALVGRSAGAQLALVAAYTSESPKIAAVVSLYGPTDLVEGWRTPPRPDPLPVRPTLEAYLGGTPDTMLARYEEASPVTYASSHAPPTLLIYGSRDHIVEARFGRELHDRLRNAGAHAILLEIPWAEHAFDILPNGLGGQLSLYYVERFLAGAIAR